MSDSLRKIIAAVVTVGLAAVVVVGFVIGDRTAEDRARAIGSRSDEANALRMRGDVLWERGDVLAARRDYEQALDIHREVDDRPNLARTARALSLLLKQHPELVTDQDMGSLLEEARETFAALGMRS